LEFGGDISHIFYVINYKYKNALPPLTLWQLSIISLRYHDVI